MSGNKKLKRIIIIIMVLVSASTIWCILWRNGNFLPRWIEWKNGDFSDSSGEYEISVSGRSVQIRYENALIWTSPDGVKVQDALSCDIDHDRKDELVLLCWKIGRYGAHKPFWVDKDEKKWSQHIFVYEFNKGEIRPKWMSSYIGLDVAGISANGKEAPLCRLWLTNLYGKISSWKWDGWGFTKEDTDVSFVIFGDNLIHEPIYRYGLRHEESFDFLFENFKEVISQSDVAVINQETPYTDNPLMYGDYPRFGTPVQVGEAVVNAGFDVVTCATNHALDRGAEGIDFTKEFFDSHNVVCLGIQSREEKEDCPYEIIVRNGIKFALFNYTYGTNGIKIPDENPYMVHLLEEEEKVKSDIERAKSEADFVIVFAHWGSEYAKQTDEFQQKWAQVFLDSKVDVVVGTHPHEIQPYEVLTGGGGHEMLIFYSIGNFISAQSEKTCVKGGMAEFTVSLTREGYRVTEYSLRPLVITWQEGGKYVADVYEEMQ